MVAAKLVHVHIEKLIVSLNVTPLARQLPGVEQTKQGESGPLATDLPLSGV
jgi:hypothetical protein